MQFLLAYHHHIFKVEEIFLESLDQILNAANEMKWQIFIGHLIGRAHKSLSRTSWDTENGSSSFLIRERMQEKIHNHD